MRRGALLTLLLIAAVLSFGLSIWSATRGRIPVLEMAHAVLFTLIALVVAARPAPTAPGCRECGQPINARFAFCIGCGRAPAERRWTTN